MVNSVKVPQAVRRRGRSKSDPNPVDIYVGARLRKRRVNLGMSQERLGEELGLTFQQVQKYERGVNRVSASRLFDMARILGVEIGFFFEDMPENVANASPGLIATFDEEGAGYVVAQDPASSRQAMELVKAYYQIDIPHLRKSLFELVKAVSHRCKAARDAQQACESEDMQPVADELPMGR